MTEIPVAASKSRPASRWPSQREVRSRQSPLNDRLARVLLFVVAFAPLPLGSTGPFFWCVSAVLVGLAGAYYANGISRFEDTFRFGFGGLRIQAALFGLLCLYLVLQALPVAAYLSAILPIDEFALTIADGSRFAPLSISLAPGATWFMLLRMGTYGVLFFLLLQVATNGQRRKMILNVLLVSVTFYAIYGLAALFQFGDTILGLPKWAYQGMATSTFVNHNSFGTFLAFGTVLAVSLALGGLAGGAEGHAGARGTRRLDPILLLYVLAFVIIVATLLTTKSRMAAFAAVCGCIVVVAANLMRSRSSWMTAFLYVPLILVGLGGAVYLYGQGLIERLGSVDESADVRLALYRQVIDMIAKRPFLGYGGGSFELAFPLFHHAPVSTSLVWDKAHDTYLALWADLGLIFGSIPILVVLLTASRLLWGLRKSGSDWTARVCALGVIVVGAVHSLADFSLEIQANAIFFVAVMALGVSGTGRTAVS